MENTRKRKIKMHIKLNLTAAISSNVHATFTIVLFCLCFVFLVLLFFSFCRFDVFAWKSNNPNSRSESNCCIKQLNKTSRFMRSVVFTNGLIKGRPPLIRYGFLQIPENVRFMSLFDANSTFYIDPDARM